MSSASAILTALSDLTNNPKLEHYDPHLCKDIHIKLDKEAREQGLSYQERFDMVITKKCYISIYEKKNLFNFRPKKICLFMINGHQYFLLASLNVSKNIGKNV
jgi:hypothetical protein